MTATDELRAELTKRGVEWKAPSSYDGSNRYDTVAGGYWFHEFDGKITIHGLTPAQAIAATLGSDRLAFLEEKVRLQGDYIIKLTKEYDALFAQSCEAATRHAGQIDAMQRKLEAATLGAGTCEADETDVIKCWVKCEDEPNTERMELIHVMECSACGGTYEHVNGGYEFCPRCGRKVVNE